MVPHISETPVKQKDARKETHGEKERYPETILVKLHYLISKYLIHDSTTAKKEKQRQTR